MTDYDEVPYPNLSHVQTHPDSLATLATLLGLTPAPVDGCRVLEIGCAAGGNLLPMAQGLPGSTFVGIDYSARQIEAGQAALAAVGYPNARLLHMNLLDLTPEFGEFDYIIAHGVYSWVPPAVREKLMAVCKDNLAPNGVAYISYNVYPGWHMLASLRDLMLWHTRAISDPRERAAQARSVLQFMAESVPADSMGRATLLNAFSKFLLQETERVGPKSDSFLLHDELEENNQPVYFHEFMAHAESHGLQFVSELDFRSALPNFYPKGVTDALLKTARNLVELEQYLDFLRNRTFRQTLLCHAGLPVNRTIKPESLRPFHLASRAVPDAEQPQLHTRTVEKFKTLDGATLSIDHPVSKAAMIHLALQWPRTVPFTDLLPAAEERLRRLNGSHPPEPPPGAQDDAYVLSTNLLKAFIYSENLVEAHIYPPVFVVEVSERPAASPWARQLAATEPKVTNLRHERVELDALTQYLLPYIDGTRSAEDLLELLLAGPVASGKLVAQQAEQPVSDPIAVRAILAGELQESLRWLGRAALLVG
ncbi:MAG: methyltransferase regulatory domain-containing protein [Anaerolineales bacterium]|nr:methyltransferase regulatory domain-containing protein [Anaerolineales bacterium]